MINKFVKCNTEIVINKKGEKAVSIDGYESSVPVRLLNFEIDDLKDVFILLNINKGVSVTVCQLVNGGYNILYVIDIDLNNELNREEPNMGVYLSNIKEDCMNESYGYIRGYLEAAIDVIIKDKEE